MLSRESNRSHVAAADVVVLLVAFAAVSYAQSGESTNGNKL